MELKLIELKKENYDQFIEMASDYIKVGEPKYKDVIDRDSYHSYLDQLEKFKNIKTTPKGYVPSFSHWLTDGYKIIGGIRYRPTLNSQLLIEGGHIGYDIRPSFRKVGYATKMLRMLLNILKQDGVNKVLITCFAEKITSEKVIIRNGGVLESIEESPRNNQKTKRFWIDIN